MKPVKLRLKIDLVSYPARAEGLGKYDKELFQSSRAANLLFNIEALVNPSRHRDIIILQLRTLWSFHFIAFIWFY